MKDGRHKRNELSRNHNYSCAKIVTAWMMLPLLRGLLLRVRLLYGPLLQLMLMLLFWEGLREVAVDASIVLLWLIPVLLCVLVPVPFM